MVVNWLLPVSILFNLIWAWSWRVHRPGEISPSLLSKVSNFVYRVSFWSLSFNWRKNRTKTIWRWYNSRWFHMIIFFIIKNATIRKHWRHIMLFLKSMRNKIILAYLYYNPIPIPVSRIKVNKSLYFLKEIAGRLILRRGRTYKKNNQ